MADRPVWPGIFPGARLKRAHKAETIEAYDWTDAFNRLVDSVREGLRNEQGAVEYVLDRQAQ